MNQQTPNEWLSTAPVVAILRGLAPEEASSIGEALLLAGLCVMEVPLNRPGALDSISILQERYGARALVGAGTVLTPADVDAAANAGAGFIVSPDANADVIQRTKERGLYSMPGFMTASEAFAAIHAGADALKLFPYSSGGAEHLKALKSVLPEATPVFCVGGVSAGNIAEVRKAGADGVGIGGALYKPGRSIDDVCKTAGACITAWRSEQ